MQIRINYKEESVTYIIYVAHREKKNGQRRGIKIKTSRERRDHIWDPTFITRYMRPTSHATFASHMIHQE